MRTGTAAARARQPSTRQPFTGAPQPQPPGWYPARSAGPMIPPAPPPPAPGKVLRYHRDLGESPNTLAGYVMDLGYDAGVVVTNDYYKVRVGGLSKNSFLLIRPTLRKEYF